MDDIERARRAVKKQRESAEPGQIARMVEESLRPGETLEKIQHDPLLESLGLPSTRLEPIPFHAPTDREPLSGYLACALTGLSPTDRRFMYLLSDSVAVVCAEHGIDLYEPRKVTDPNFNANIPDTKVFEIDRDKVLTSDVLIFLSHFPSVGAGQELDFAYNAMIPIIVIAQSDVRVSRMVTGIPGRVIKVEYTDPQELREALASTLEQLKPLLQERRTIMQDHSKNIVGDRIRRAREAQNLTRSEVEEASSRRGQITVAQLAKWEASTDRESNMSLLQLREIASLLGTTVADLVEADMNAIHLAYFNTLIDKVDESTAARNRSDNYADRWHILVRILDRMRNDLDYLHPNRDRR